MFVYILLLYDISLLTIHGQSSVGNAGIQTCVNNYIKMFKIDGKVTICMKKGFLSIENNIPKK